MSPSSGMRDMLAACQLQGESGTIKKNVHLYSQMYTCNIAGAVKYIPQWILLPFS